MAGIGAVAVIGLWFICSLQTSWIAYGPARWALALTLGLTHLVFALTLARGLVELCAPLNCAWLYRAAVLTSAGLGLSLWLSRSDEMLFGIHLLACAWAGTFLGGLLATAIDNGIFEESYRPSSQLCEEVYRQHTPWRTLVRVEPHGKRLFDLILALLGMLLSWPLWLLFILLIWLEEPGPIFFVKHSVGRGGTSFRQLKFRTMKLNAEQETGPIPASREDQRILRSGKFLRKTTSDELPQLVNVLRGEMSIVGPRPLRTVVVREYLPNLPQFAERHTVRPGIAGLAQVRGGYYVTPLQRLRFDRLYIHHMSFGLDLRILGSAVLITLLRWKPSLKRSDPKEW